MNQLAERLANTFVDFYGALAPEWQPWFERARLQAEGFQTESRV